MKSQKFNLKRKKNIFLVTGAAGFIGSSICRYLLSLEGTQSVIGVDNINSYYSIKLKKRRIQELSVNKCFVFYKESILNKEKIALIVQQHKPNILIHTAAEVGVRNGESNVLSYYSSNVLGAMTVLESSKESINHAVILSSSSVYGLHSDLPSKEQENITLHNPISVYGASKAAMEIAVHNFFRRTKVPTTIIRPFSVFGPDGRPDMLPIKLLLAAKLEQSINVYAPKNNFRDWTYIDDFVRGIGAILKNPDKFQIVNLGTGSPLRLDQTLKIAQKIIKKYGYSLSIFVKPANAMEVSITHASTEKMNSKYNIVFENNFEEGYKRTADFFFNHLDLYL